MTTAASHLCSHAPGRTSTVPVVPLAASSPHSPTSRAPQGALGPARALQGALGLRAALVALALCLVGVSSAHADATVVVELKRADGGGADGTILLSRGEVQFRCVTSEGRCEMKNVPGGTYTVEVEQGGAQPAGKRKSVMIPPSGEVKLIVAAK